MAIAPFLAMTAAEFCAAAPLPSKIAWMACHFSPYGLGLSNLPKDLPPGSLLMVDDMTPPQGHDPQFIAEQLSERVEALQCCGVLLDFQRKDHAQTLGIAKHLAAALPCPTAISEWYASELDCAVFLPPVPPSVPLEAYLQPWNNRKIWLELGTDGEQITLTETGAEVFPLPYPDMNLSGFQEDVLCCHYNIRTNKKSARFTLWRTKEDFEKLLQNVENLGISETVALYQELSLLE